MDAKRYEQKLWRNPLCFHTNLAVLPRFAIWFQAFILEIVPKLSPKIKNYQKPQ
jgi:hypothetical protein